MKVRIRYSAQEALIHASKTWGLNPHFSKDSQHEATHMNLI